MKTTNSRSCYRMAASIIMGFIWSAANQTTLAHCDTEKGPLIQEARAALQKGDPAPLLKWVRKEKEAEIKSAFTLALSVRTKGSDAMQLADRYFIETLVRIHRAGEGAPYTGIKDEPVDPVIAMADKALDEGSADRMILQLGNHLEKVIRGKFSRAVEAAKHKNDSIEAGREFVEAYVDYVHYVENVHAAIAVQKSNHADSDPGDRGHGSHMH